MKEWLRQRRQGLPSPSEAAWAWIELAGLVALVWAYPITEEIREAREVLPSFGVRGAEAIQFVVLLIAVPATLLFAAELAAGIARPPARRWAHAALIGGLACLMPWQAIQENTTSNLLDLGVLLAGFCVVTVAFLSFEWARSFVRYLGFAVPVVVLAFVVRSPVVDTFGDDRGDQLTISSRTAEFRAQDTQHPVVMIVFDELPLASLLGEDGRIDARLFPNFARLAETSTWYPRARGVADQTIQALPTILTGQMVSGEKPPSAPAYPDNIFSLLGDSHEFNVHETLTDMCPRELCESRFSRGTQFANLLWRATQATDFLPFGLSDRIGEEIVNSFPRPPPAAREQEQFIESLDDLAPGAEFSFAHIELPHIPWSLLADGNSYYDPGVYGLQNEAWLGPAYWARQGFQRHILQAQFVDRRLGVMLDKLETAGVLDRSLLVVLADHGAAFIPGYSRRGISPMVSGWILRVPMFIKAPGQRNPQVSRDRIRTLDVVPTIAALLGGQQQEGWDGTPFGRASDPEIADTYVSFNTGETRIPDSVIDARFRDAVALRNEILRSGDPYALAGQAELLGQPIEAAVGARRIEVALDSPEQFSGVYPPGGVVPALITGFAYGFGGPADAAYAAVVNGRIAATGRFFGENDQTRVATMVPASAFRQGENRIEFFLLPRR